jgi:selenoprotein W-related protein
VSVELIKSSGGVFEIDVDGNNVYSKKRTGFFPDPHEIVDQLARG